MEAHTTRLTTLTRDLTEQLHAGDHHAALQTLTALRARCDVIGRELLPLPADDAELSEVAHG